MPTSRPLWQQVLLVMSALAVLVSLGAVAAYQVDYQTEEQDLREETSRLAAFVTVQIKDQVQRQGTSEATVASVSGLFGQLPLPDGSLLTLTDQDSRILGRRALPRRPVRPRRCPRSSSAWDSTGLSASSRTA
jgi:hypothetical protein